MMGVPWILIRKLNVGTKSYLQGWHNNLAGLSLKCNNSCLNCRVGRYDTSCLCCRYGTLGGSLSWSSNFLKDWHPADVMGISC